MQEFFNFKDKTRFSQEFTNYHTKTLDYALIDCGTIFILNLDDDISAEITIKPKIRM